MLLAAFVPHAAKTLDLSAAEIGLTLGVYGVGMIIGALAAPAILRALRFGVVTSIGPVFGALAALVMASTVVWPLPALAVLSFFLLGVGPILWVITTATLRQRVTPGDLLGRVSPSISCRTARVRWGRLWPP